MTPEITPETTPALTPDGGTTPTPAGTETETRTRPGWATRINQLGEDIGWAVDGWSKVPRPPARVTMCVAGALWTAAFGPPEFVEQLMTLLPTP